MAGEQLAVGPQEMKLEKKPGVVKRSALWVGEKSTYITFPIAGVIFLAGAGVGSGALMAVGGAGMAVDVVQNRVFSKWRKKDQQPSEAQQGPLARVAPWRRQPAAA